MFRLALFVAPALAWGPDGHATIAEIAHGMLSAEANKTMALIAGEGTLIADHSSWPDVVRKNDPENFGWSGNRHYVNVPKGTCNFDYERDCADGHCHVGAIANYTERMMDASLSQEERWEALRFVVHFVGDLHQPLHNGFIEDQDGNTIKVSIPFADGNDTNLHKVWDEKMIDMYEEPLSEEWVAQDAMDRNLPRREYWTPMYQHVLAELQVGGKYYDDIAGYTTECVKNGHHACLSSFSTETMGVVCTKAYLNENGQEIMSNDTLTQAYADDRLTITHDLLAKAAVRLSYILETTLTASSTPNDATSATAWLSMVVAAGGLLLL